MVEVVFCNLPEAKIEGVESKEPAGKVPGNVLVAIARRERNIPLGEKVTTAYCMTD